MKYKFSKFNLVTQYDNKTLVFNSLKNTFCAFEGNKENDFKLQNELSEEQKSFLYAKGILVNKDTDEDKLARIKYVKLIQSEVLHLIIMPTLQCNFRCTYCYEDKTGSIMTGEVIDSVVNFVKKHIQEVRGINVSWFGGEPLLCMDVIAELSERLIKITKYYKKTYFSDITTNGYYLTVENLYKLLKCNVINYQITIDGNEKFHNQTRPLANGQGTYETIMNNLKNIRDQVTTRIFTIVIRNNLTIESINEMEEFTKQLAMDFGSDNRFSFMFRRVGNWGGEDVKNMLDQIIEDEDLLLLKLLESKEKLFISKQFTHFEKYPFCYAACENNFVFGPKGQVQKCTVDLENEFNHVGKLDKYGEANFNEHYVKWIYSMFNRELENKCENCKLYANCFANVCPLVLINEKMYNPSECKNLDKELQVLYKMRKDKFEEVIF